MFRIWAKSGTLSEAKNCGFCSSPPTRSSSFRKDTKTKSRIAVCSETFFCPAFRLEASLKPCFFLYNLQDNFSPRFSPKVFFSTSCLWTVLFSLGADSDRAWSWITPCSKICNSQFSSLRVLRSFFCYPLSLRRKGFHFPCLEIAIFDSFFGGLEFWARGIYFCPSRKACFKQPVEFIYLGFFLRSILRRTFQSGWCFLVKIFLIKAVKTAPFPFAKFCSMADS